MAKTPTVSVALCTHNGASYIEEQLTSVLQQTIRPIEIVLSDDNSSDDTVALAKSLVESSVSDDSRPVILRVIQNGVALGVVKNFEQALLACEGDFIALCDQDDIWHPQRLERLTGRLTENPALSLVHSDAALVDDAGVSLGVSLLDSLNITASERAEIHGGQGFRALLRRNLVTGATAVIRRELLAPSTPFPEVWVHDEWLAMMAAATARFDLVEEVLTDYRQHDGNQIGAVKLSLRNKISKLREPRMERNEHLVARGRALVAKLDELGDRVSVDDRKRAAEKLRHDLFRLGLPASPVRRALPILREGARAYRDFSLGGIDMLRDLVQPAE